MGVLGGKCADVKLAREWKMGMARDCCCCCWLGGGGWRLVGVGCGSIGIIKIIEGIIFRRGNIYELSL